MSPRPSNLTIPNVLSGLRMASVPLLLFLAGTGEARLYLVCLGISLATDLVDGPLARLLKQQTELGARLDVWADAAVLLTLPVAIWLLWPEVLRREGWFIALGVASYVVSAGYSWWKFGRPASYHTRYGKKAQAGFCVGTFVTLLGWAHWPFRAGLLLMIAAILEELAISVALNEARSNVPSWRQARLLRASAAQPGGSPQGT